MADQFEENPQEEAQEALQEPLQDSVREEAQENTNQDSLQQISAKKRRKLPKIAIYAIVFGAAAIIFLCLAIGGAAYSVNRTKSAIDDIWSDGDITYTAETRSKIETAISYYDALDTNISLDKRVSNANKLTEARSEYTRLAILQLYRAENSGADEETIIEYIYEARDVYDSIIGDSGITVSNYTDLTDAEENYGISSSSDDGSDTSSGSEEQEEIEIC